MNLRGLWVRSSTTLLAACLTLVLLSAAVACAGARYEPAVPMQSQVDDIDIRMKSLQSFQLEYTFETHASRTHRIRSAWLTAPSKEACGSGTPASSIEVEGSASKRFDLTPGTHIVQVKFGNEARSPREDLVVDFELDRSGCLRVPVLSHRIPLRPKPQIVTVFALQLEGNTDLWGLGGLFGFRVGAGTWLGPVLTTAEVGYMGAQCTKSACGKDEKGQLNFGNAFPLAINTRTFPLSGVQGGFLNSLALGIRYMYVPVQLPALDGDRHFAIHGIHGVFGWTIADAFLAPFGHAERNLLFEFSVPVGIWLYPGSLAHKAAFGTGFDMQFNLPL
jgi:hypothetical protein